jgi:cation/acetate symporter
MPRVWIGYLFMFATIVAVRRHRRVCRTSNVSEYYVAGRRVPALFNGMATAADWISAASFISLAGGLYLQGFDGLAYIMGWTGGYCLVALLIAPYLRKFGQYTIPDFLGARYGGRCAEPRHRHALRRAVRRAAGAHDGGGATILVSFTYVVAQIYGVGLIASRFTGVDFSVGIFLGLASILVCSFLGGMRAITWTQVAQYIIILVAFLIPVVWLSAKHADNPVPQVATARCCEAGRAREGSSPPIQAERKCAPCSASAPTNTRPASRPARVVGSGPARGAAHGSTEDRRQRSLTRSAGRARAAADYPKNALAAEARAPGRPRGRQPRARRAAEPHAEPFPAPTKEESDDQAQQLPRAGVLPDAGHRRAAAHPDALLHHAVGARNPGLGVLDAVLHPADLPDDPGAGGAGQIRHLHLAGRRRVRESCRPGCRTGPVDKANPLISIADINRDGIVQLAEIAIDGDVLVLATPEIAGLPYVISGLVAAGGLAAALSTADGLLLAISNALSHDVYYKLVDPAPRPRSG